MNFITTLITIVISSVVDGKLIIKKFEKCDPETDYKIKMTFKLKEDTDPQVVEEAMLSNQVQLGNNILNIIDVYASDDGVEYERLVTINEYLCDVVAKYVGEFMIGMQKAAGLESATCPLPPGNYSISDYTLDFEKYKFKMMRMIPEGHFKTQINLTDASTKEILNCSEMEFVVEE